MMSYTPSKRFFLILGIILCLSLGAFLWDGFAWLWLGSLVLLCVAGIVDTVLLLKSHATLLNHQWDHHPTIQQPFALMFHLQMQMPPYVSMKMKSIDSDVLNPSKPTAHLMTLTDTGEVQATMELFPKRRGNLHYPGANIRYHTPLHLVNKWQRVGQMTLPVYPKILQNLQTQLNPNLLREQLGRKINRFRRADQDFESLRPYVQGDNYRHIDWKASARLQSWITRTYQLEHHHNILICLDTSRLMGTLTEGISKLDWAIEATLQLSYLASHFNDKIGLLVFSNDVDRWVKPLNSPVEAFLKAMYDVESKIVEADFYKVCQAIMAAQKKRSLVIFLSDFIEASSLEPVLKSFAQLNQKHCSLFIGIEDPVYKHFLEENTIDTPLEASETLVALDSMKRRQATLQHLRQMGLKALTVSPNNLVQRAMNAYLEIKFQGAI